MKAYSILLALFCVLHGGASLALPDLARGLAAAQDGEVERAETDLLPLAEQGYVEAQAGLGRLYARQRNSESAVKAVHWLRIAAEQDPSLRVSLARSLLNAGSTVDPQEVDRLLAAAVKDRDPEAPALQLRVYRQYPQLADPAKASHLAQALAASKRVEDRAEAISWYRANSTQGQYEAPLQALCEKDRRLIEDCYAELARHYRATNDRARLTQLQKEVLERVEKNQVSRETIERIARVLSAEDLAGASSPRAAYALLAGLRELSPEAMARKARLLLLDPSLDPHLDATGLLKAAYAQGSMEAALSLGRLYLDEDNPAADPVEAERLLGKAAQTLPAAHFHLGRMFERGHLGSMNARRAQRHYLLAARAGYPRADLALAQMYWSNRGVMVDPVTAYAFARLAVHAGVPGSPEFITQLRSALGEAEIARGQRMAEREFAARKAAGSGPGVPSITTAEAGRP